MFKGVADRPLMFRYYLETYGCSLNMADSDLMVGRLALIGGKRISEPDSADILIVNTCAVKEPTEDRVIYRVGELDGADIPLIITGCLPKINLPRLLDAVPHHGAILGPQSVEKLGPVVKAVLSGERGIIDLKPDKGSKLRFFQGPPHSVVCTIPICEGCLGACSYCAVRFARESVRSYSIETLGEVVKNAVSSGYKEIRLTAQDAATYGSDTGESLINLLSRLDEIPGDHRFRLGMFNCNLVLDSLDELLGVMNSQHFFRFFHMPVQSGSDAILHSMNRRYSVAEWVSAVRTIRRVLPSSTVATDIIVGHPGETKADFAATMDLIRTVRPEVVNISKYGDRPGTPASESDVKVDTSVKKNRSRRLSKLVSTILSQKAKAWLGWVGPVLVTSLAPKGGLLARTPSYRPVIIDNDVPLGTTLPVQISSAERTYLVGEVSDLG
ncbi:tRNA (N(6)-L-threonylcarbamoyladenosine(37)-C(2))-methylthiotransferase [Candidatus Thorarchaeota archaeon]|nr:MAG: tRNA (N(6)-L-threonylcarbamoyladenosine(37)-C(2))-methylthiotransferase [Candidatus Thorarchaeota archaeon]